MDKEESRNAASWMEDYINTLRKNATQTRCPGNFSTSSSMMRVLHTRIPLIGTGRRLWKVPARRQSSIFGAATTRCTSLPVNPMRWISFIDVLRSPGSIQRFCMSYFDKSRLCLSTSFFCTMPGSDRWDFISPLSIDCRTGVCCSRWGVLWIYVHSNPRLPQPGMGLMAICAINAGGGIDVDILL